MRESARNSRRIFPLSSAVAVELGWILGIETVARSGRLRAGCSFRADSGNGGGGAEGLAGVVVFSGEAKTTS